MKDAEFTEWLATTLNLSGSDVNQLLNNESAIKFLIAWSIFESRCFNNKLTGEKIKDFPENPEGIKKFDAVRFSEYAEYFHHRYKCKQKFSNLMHGTTSARFKKYIDVDYVESNSTENIFLCIFVVFRYRNNIFHGNKGVINWLNYADEINKCTEIMKIFISHYEPIDSKLKKINYK